MSNNNKPLRLSTLEEYKKALSQKDAIMEPNVYTDTLSEYINLGGQPFEAVNYLSESYVGIPSMCNATASSVGSYVNSDQIMQRAIRQQLKERFDPKKCDEYFMEQPDMAPEWLGVLIEDQEWRRTLYELLEKNPSSQFLNFAIMRIAEAGHKAEVSKLRTASTYVKVFNLILQDALGELIVKDDLEFEQEMPSLIRVCCEREDTYLYAQILLARLSKEYGAVQFTRVCRELEVAAKEKGNQVFVDLIHSQTSPAPIELSKTIQSIMNSTNITMGDIVTLKRLYASSNNKPSSIYLCDYDLIIKLLRSLYVPQNGSLLRADLVDDVVWLIAYATSINDNNPQEDEMREVQRVLKDLYQCLFNKTEVGSITGAMKFILSAIRYPVGSMAILLWIEYMATNTTYFETYFRSTEIPVLLLILDEIASRHQLQQPIVFDVIKRCIKHKTEIFAPEIQLTLQKTWVDRMLYLVQLNYTIPVLKYFIDVGRELDDSLIVHFIKKLLKMAEPPYSITFIQHMVAIVEHLVENLMLIKDVQQLVVSFLVEAKDTRNLDDHTREKIKSILYKM